MVRPVSEFSSMKLMAQAAKTARWQLWTLLAMDLDFLLAALFQVKYNVHPSGTSRTACQEDCVGIAGKG